MHQKLIDLTTLLQNPQLSPLVYRANLSTLIPFRDVSVTDWQDFISNQLIQLLKENTHNSLLHEKIKILFTDYPILQNFITGLYEINPPPVQNTPSYSLANINRSDAFKTYTSDFLLLQNSIGLLIAFPINQDEHVTAFISFLITLQQSHEFQRLQTMVSTPADTAIPWTSQRAMDNLILDVGKLLLSVVSHYLTNIERYGNGPKQMMIDSSFILRLHQSWLNLFVLFAPTPEIQSNHQTPSSPRVPDPRDPIVSGSQRLTDTCIGEGRPFSLY